MKLWLIALISLAICTVCAQTREPARAGQWYPADGAELKTLLQKLFREAGDSKAIALQNPVAIISPHAGFIYSGSVAAAGFAGLREKQFDTVVILGTSHRVSNGTIALYTGDYFKTPLGAVPIDKSLAQELLKGEKKVVSDAATHTNEHSIEAQVPFLQYKLDALSIVPVLTATEDSTLLASFGTKLAKVVAASKKRVLVVASTDLSHFHDYHTAQTMDAAAVRFMAKNDSSGLSNAILSGTCEACGYHAFLILSAYLQASGAGEGHLIKALNSGDIIGESRPGGVVGYTSIVFEKGKAAEKVSENGLAGTEHKYLLQLARKTINDYLKNGKTETPSEPASASLKNERAVFVTLQKQGDLRGCIGQLEAKMPLYKAVHEMALSAAFHDPRFSPVKAEEMKEIIIEISVLTPMKKIKNHKEIILKRDGVVIRKGYNGGVFLPQVAEETGWDLKTFLESLCTHKAGLPANCYTDPSAELFVFQVEKFTE